MGLLSNVYFVVNRSRMSTCCWLQRGRDNDTLTGNNWSEFETYAHLRVRRADTVRKDR